jgi:hypothetical protein
MIKEIDKICPKEGQTGPQNKDPPTQNMISSIITRGGSGFLLHKTQSPSPRVGLRPKPNFITYVVKPEPKPN